MGMSFRSSNNSLDENLFTVYLMVVMNIFSLHPLKRHEAQFYNRACKNIRLRLKSPRGLLVLDIL